MKGIVFDLELNAPGTDNEQIIEIGACLVNYKSRTILKEFQTFCRLRDGVSLDPEIATLCNITEEQVNAGVDLGTGIRAFWDFVTQNNCAANVSCWGPDFGIIRRQSLSLGIVPPARIFGFDIMGMARRLHLRPQSGTTRGLRGHLSAAGLDFIGNRHRALDDTRNTVYLEFQWLRRYEIMSLVEGAMATPLTRTFTDKQRKGAIGSAPPLVIENHAPQIINTLSDLTSPTALPNEFSYKGNDYRVRSRDLMRLDNGDWIDAVSYENAETRAGYVRSLPDFTNMMSQDSFLLKN